MSSQQYSEVCDAQKTTANGNTRSSLREQSNLFTERYAKPVGEAESGGQSSTPGRRTHNFTKGNTTMSTKITAEDREILRSMGISDVEAATIDADRMALARRIAKHPAPVQVKVDPNRARLELVRLALRKLLDALEARNEATH
jgi:hypothetical protein